MKPHGFAAVPLVILTILGPGCSESPAYSLSGYVVLHGVLRDFAGSITGERTVTDADGVPVYLMRSGIIVDSATTSDGGYEFTAIEPGSYRVLSIIALASADTTLETVVRSDVTVADTLRLGPAGDITVIPNPFQSAVSATFAITAIDTVDVSVMNAAGQPIRTLAHGILPLGQHQIVWDGLYPNHSEAPDGAYWMVFSQGVEHRADLAFKGP